jgi:hypothetical protein
MAFKKWFGKKEESEESLYREYTLDTLQVGFLVDYDLKTWQVSGYATYDYDGYLTREWELKCGDEVRFLERDEEDGRAFWTLVRRIALDQIQEKVAQAIAKGGDPPEELHCAGQLYTGVDSAAGLYRKDGKGPEQEFVSWSFESEEGRVLFISQWGERDFSAHEGEYVEEYQFTDILPGGGEG